MNELVDLWVYLSSAPLFGLTATLGVYVLALAAGQRLGQPPWANPVLWSVVVIAAVLWATGTPYARYFGGAQFIHVMLGPAVVALAVPIWERRRIVRRHLGILLSASVVGGAAAAGSAVLLARWLDLSPSLVASLAPKSVTAPVAMGIAERIGGVPALAAAFAVLTGVTGAVIAQPLFEALRVRDEAVRGFALGTASHGIGAARALQSSAQAGAFAGLGLGLQVLIASVAIPLAASLLR